MGNFMSQHRYRITELLERLPAALLDAYHHNPIFHNLVQKAAQVEMSYVEFLEMTTEYFINLQKHETDRKINEAMRSTHGETRCSCGAVLLYGKTHINCPDGK